MRNPFVYGVGGVLSADIAVPEHDRELDFYSKILTTGDAPLWREDLMNNRGTPIIGLGPRTPAYESLPLQWMPHFQVADVADSVAGALEMGGQELMHDDKSRWAVLTDQFGAAFGVIPAVPDDSEPSGQNERLGCISWLSLNVPNALSSRDFYQRVVGWNVRSNDAEPGKGVAAGFEMQIDDETAAAEIRQFDSGQNTIPSAWLIHLPVDDLTESLRRVDEGGGVVVKEDAKTEDAVVRDPIGVYLALRVG